MPLHVHAVNDIPIFPSRGHIRLQARKSPVATGERHARVIALCASAIGVLLISRIEATRRSCIERSMHLLAMT
ncbi:hypothetical protein [Caballeronia sp. INDeC2]|uniref:hypothetical protein n=1 Tax=Caballeronia sp. INDeC2 TaxID=2921747 RepID=UPI0020296F22|nr:hypothetical protein [Caballeronia sp. INDeC2]